MEQHDFIVSVGLALFAHSRAGEKTLARAQDLTVQLLRARGKVAELEQAAARAAGPAGAEKEQEALRFLPRSTQPIRSL